MDEPLSNLDAKLRMQMRAEISGLHRRLRSTFLFVTHDQGEAMTMSDRVAVMMGGELIQVGAPEELYHDPNDLRVAEFIGPKINVMPVEALVRDGRNPCAALQLAENHRSNKDQHGKPHHPSTNCRGNHAEPGKGSGDLATSVRQSIDDIFGPR
jgi:ABC-type sugar transport system ATPase subunit